MNWKSFTKKTIRKSGILSLRAKLRPQCCAVVYFHSVSEYRNRDGHYIAPAISVEAERFREYMRLLRRDFHPVTLDDLTDWLNGRRELPRRSVVVTFDDGFADNAHVAAPVMEEFDIRGTFYLTTACIEHQTLPWFCKILCLFHHAGKLGRVVTHPETSVSCDLSDPRARQEVYRRYVHACVKLPWEKQNDLIAQLEKTLDLEYDEANAPKMMTWDDARELERRGHLIGNHTFSHANVAHMAADEKRNDIERSHALLETRLGHPPAHFSYPHPCLDPQRDAESDEVVRSLRYRSCVLTEFGTVDRKTNPLEISRISIGQMESEEFLWKLETAFAGLHV